MPASDIPPMLPRHEPLRVLLLLSSLHGGGAERVAVQLLNRLDRARFQARMGLLRAAGPYLGEVDPARLLVAPDGDRRFDFDGANRRQFTPARLIRGAFDAPRAIAAMIEEVRPHVVLSFLKGTNLMVWRALARLSGPRALWIAREGNNVLAVIREEAPFALAAHAVAALTARAYRAADRVLAISADLGRDIVRDLRLDPAKVATIHNPVDLETIRTASRERPANLPLRPFVLAAGRLERQKRFDLLLHAFARSGAAASHDLVILGEGSLGAELLGLADALRIADRVHWPGFQANPFAWMGSADLFVLSSRWEGFGNVVVEAMAAGAPALAADCDYGPREIVEHGKNGWLVAPDSVEALAAGLTALLGDPALRARLAEAGERASEKFGIDALTARYAALIEDVARPAPVPG